MKNEKIKLGETYKKIRQSKGFTQDFVAEKLDLSSRYVSDLERNKSLGGISTLIDLCNLYKVTPTIVLKDYLDIKNDIQIDAELSGFYTLTQNEKEIVLNLISFMNKQSYTKKEERKKKKRK